MSILIKGMEMPQDCWHCEFCKTTMEKVDFCAINRKQYNWGLKERPSDCPLIEVPDKDVQPVKHGKWEDSIAKYGILRHKCSVCNKYSHMAYNYCPNCGARMDGDA